MFLLILLAGDIATNPGPEATNCCNIQCLYFNARSLLNKTSELQTMMTDIDLLAVTETWLKPERLDCEILYGNSFNIYRRNRTDRSEGGVLLAVRENIFSMRRKDLETSAEIIVCEVRPVERKKIAVIVFYRPPDSDLQYIKEFKRSLQLVQRCNRFDQVIICGDFNRLDIDWKTGTASNNNSIISNHFTKTVKDFYLCQMVYFPFRGENTLDLILTTYQTKLKTSWGLMIFYPRTINSLVSTLTSKSKESQKLIISFTTLRRQTGPVSGMFSVG